MPQGNRHSALVSVTLRAPPAPEAACRETAAVSRLRRAIPRENERAGERGGAAAVAANGTSKEKTVLRTGQKVGGSKPPQAALFVQASQVTGSVKHTKGQRDGQQSLAWRTYMVSAWLANFRLTDVLWYN